MSADVELDLEHFAKWRERVAGELDEHRRRGKSPRLAPTTDAEWLELYRTEPRPVYASWLAITGRHARRRS